MRRRRHHPVIYLRDSLNFITGGAVHVVVNNQLGFTTDTWKGRSSWYCTDVGKAVLAPALHANADDPEAVVLASQVAMEYREKWFKDVFIDLNGYRRHGHNELDEVCIFLDRYYIVADLGLPACIHTTNNV